MIKKHIYKLLRLFLVWRLALFIPVAIAPYILSYRLGYGYAHIIDYLRQPYPFPLYLPVVYSWANFDGIHYLNIAGAGYSNNMRFFPLYPILIYIGKLIFRSQNAFDFGAFMSGFLVANFAFLGAVIILYKLLRLDYPSDFSHRSILFLLTFPTAFFFVSLYSESLFLLLSVLVFYFARKQNWLAASISAAFLTATRVVGIMILPALILEYLHQQNITIKNWRKVIFSVVLLKNVSLFFLSLFGVTFYSIYNWYRWKNPFLFFISQGDVANNRSVSTVILPPQTVYRYYKILTSLSISQHEWWVAVIELVTFILASWLLYLAWRRKIRLSYLFFSWGCFLMPTLTGTFTGLPRYVIVIFPLFVVLAGFKNRLFPYFYLILSVILQIILLMLFSRGYYIA